MLQLLTQHVERVRNAHPRHTRAQGLDPVQTVTAKAQGGRVMDARRTDVVAPELDLRHENAFAQVGVHALAGADI